MRISYNIFIIFIMFILLSCSSGVENDNMRGTVFYGYDFPDPVITNFDTSSGKGYLSMEITLQVKSSKDVDMLGAKRQLLEHAVVTFLAKKETQDILPDLVTDPDRMGEYIQEAIKESVEFEAERIIFRSFIRQ
jgi:flagellar basal body-associated protein FliL